MQSLADVIRTHRKENPTEAQKETPFRPLTDRDREFYLWKKKLEALPPDNESLIIQHKNKARVRTLGSTEVVEAIVELENGFSIEVYHAEDKESGKTSNKYFLWDNIDNRCYFKKLI